MNYYTQEDVAEFLGVSVMTYHRYENEVTDITAKSLLKLSQLYKVPIDLLLKNDDMLNEYVKTKIEFFMLLERNK